MKVPHMRKAGFSKVDAERFFGGNEVVEATMPLMLQPNTKDFRKAEKSNGKNCALAVCAKRVFGSRYLAILGTVAYVDTLDEKGKRVVNRYAVSAAGQKFIRDFDAGEPISPAGFLLLPPTRSQTLKGRAESKEKRKNLGRVALIKGQVRYGSSAKRPRRKAASVTRLNSLRDGRGMVHFLPTK